MTTYSTFDIVKILGIPRERLKDWMSHGFIEPSTPAQGKGTKAEFTWADIYIILIFMEFLNIGVSRRIASREIKKNRDKILLQGGGIYFFVVGDKGSYIAINLNIINEYLQGIIP